jgi:hypothetical protein
MHIRIEIDLGNDAMQTATAAGMATNLALHAHAQGYANDNELKLGDHGIIRDANGNTVGAWVVENRS